MTTTEMVPRDQELYSQTYFLRNLRTGQISQSVRNQQAFPDGCNATLQLIGPIDKFRRIGSVVNTAPQYKYYHAWTLWTNNTFLTQ